MPAKAEVKQGFYLALGILFALFVVGLAVRLLAGGLGVTG